MCVHEIDVWSGRMMSSSDRLSQEVKLGSGCSVTSLWLRVSDLLHKALVPEEQARRWLGWTRLLTVVQGSVWVCPCALKVRPCLAHCLLLSFGRGNPLTHSLGGPLRVAAHTCMITAQLSDRRKVNSAGRCLLDCGGLPIP